MTNRYIVLLFVSVIAACLTSCNKLSNNDNLIKISRIINDSPEQARTLLNEIDRASLDQRDRQFYDFLDLKTNDKLYVDHTSDSTIVRLIAYYKDTSLYPEILYYGGRVYSDLGDYPTSLKYFHEALDIIPDSRDNLILKSHALSQTGRLLNTLRMYDNAIPYIEEALKIDSIESKIYNLAYDNQLLGAILIHQKQYDKAEKYINKAYDFSLKLTDEDIANMRMYQSAVQLKKGNVDSALVLIRGLPSKVDPVSRNAALICASDIYMANDIPDTAYAYAHKLIESQNINNLKNGYRNLLSKKLINLVPTDSLQTYVSKYADELDNFYKLNDLKQSIIQESFYNYQFHEKERIKVEQKNAGLKIIIIIVVGVLLISMIIILALRNRRNKLLLRLNQTINELNQLREDTVDLTSDKRNSQIVKSDDVQQLRNQINFQIQLLTEQNKNIPISQEILNSDIYKKIKDYLAKGKPISESSEIWAELDSIVCHAYPRFRKRVYLLADQKLKEPEYRLLLLIKSGITPTQTLTLLGRTKGAISYRRKRLNEVLFGGEIDLTQIDDVIRCI